jgi:hypothetical protein
MLEIFLRFTKIVFIFTFGIAVGYKVAQHKSADAIAAYPANTKQSSKVQSNLATPSVRILENNIRLTTKKNIPEKLENKNCGELSELLDVNNIRSLIDNMQSQNSNIRRRTLIALSLFGNSNIKQQVAQIIFDDNEEDLALRRDLIKLTNWQTSSNFTQLIDSTQSAEIKIAAIQSVQTSHFNDFDKQIIGKEIEWLLVNDPDDYVKINALDYFAYTDKEKLSEVINLISKNDINPEVQNHIQFLTRPFSTRNPG